MPSSSRAIRSAASSSRCLALRWTCGAAPPCVRQTVMPRLAGLRQRSPFFRTATQRF
ncbi:Uncharacterised protein [Mycobacteroides abscessus subsp. abscessus]|nr:Uncharacterised protein [Mycobacteroides abscessus subsp. abscessus]